MLLLSKVQMHSEDTAMWRSHPGPGGPSLSISPPQAVKTVILIKGEVQYVGLPRSTGRREQLPKHPFLATEATPESGDRRQGLVWLGPSLGASPSRADTHVGPPWHWWVLGIV